MFSIIKENEWTEPQSMGIPLNTTEDDLYYVINSRGRIEFKVHKKIERCNNIPM